MNIFEKFYKDNKINSPLILDGATGSLLEHNYPDEIDKDIWMTRLLIDRQESVQSIHYDYLNSGANIITSMTFRTNPCSINKYNQINKNSETLDFEVLVEKALEACKNCKKERNCLIAGSNPPGEDCYSRKRTLDYEKLKDNHINHISALVKHGSDFVLNETFGHVDEIDLVSKFCFNNNYPNVISLYFDENLRTLCGEEVIKVVSRLDQMNLQAISFNCIDAKPFDDFVNVYTESLINLKTPLGFYLNCGDTDVHQMQSFVKRFNNLNPIFVGTCCMSDPTYTKSISELFDSK